MAVHASHMALPFPVKGARFSVLIPYLDADGDPTDPGTPDTEISKDGAAAADTTEEVSVITGTGLALMTFTGDETNCSGFGIHAKPGSGPKATLGTFYPRVLPTLTSGTCQSGSTASTIKLASGAPAYTLVGTIIQTTGGTGGGGGSGSQGNQARVCTAYNTSMKVATVVPDWETTPDNTTTYKVLDPGASVGGIGFLLNDGLPTENDGGVYEALTFLLNAMGPFSGDAFNNVWGFLRAIANKDATLPADLDVGGGFDNDTDSLQSIRDYTAAQADVLAITNNTRVVRVVPPVMERPDSGSTAFRIEILLYDEVGNMEAPDSAPTISVVDESGSSRDVNLDSTTMSLVSTGRYRSTYTVGTAHDIEELIFAFSVVEGGATRVYANAALVVDTTAVDFTASDRADLAAIKTKTDQMNFTGTDVKATLDGETVVLTDGSLTAAKIAAGAISAAKLAADAGNKIADHVLRRSWASAAASSDGDTVSFRSLLGAVAKLVNRVRVSGGTLTVYEADDTTPLGTQTVTDDAAADPIVEVNTD